MLVGKKPSKTKRLVLWPDNISAVIQAAAPGAEVTIIPSLSACLTKSSPGSDMPGVPASVTIVIFFPLLSSSISSLPLSSLLCSW